MHTGNYPPPTPSLISGLRLREITIAVFSVQGKWKVPVGRDDEKDVDLITKP